MARTNGLLLMHRIRHMNRRKMVPAAGVIFAILTLSGTGPLVLHEYERAKIKAAARAEAEEAQLYIVLESIVHELEDQAKASKSVHDQVSAINSKDAVPRSLLDIASDHRLKIQDLVAQTKVRLKPIELRIKALPLENQEGPQLERDLCDTWFESLLAWKQDIDKVVFNESVQISQIP